MSHLPFIIGATLGALLILCINLAIASYLGRRTQSFHVAIASYLGRRTQSFHVPWRCHHRQGRYLAIWRMRTLQDRRPFIGVVKG